MITSNPFFLKHPVTSQHIARTHQYFTRKRRLNGFPNLRVDQVERIGVQRLLPCSRHLVQMI